jgi:C4-dicarboxylate-specific signal transduction histidine kinase
LLYRNERCGLAFGSNLSRVQEIERRLKAPGSPQPLPPPSAEGSQVELEDAATGRWYLLAARAIRWMDGRPVGLYIATDVTERRRTEELGRQQQARLEMTSRLTTLGEMASTLAHEINQPLTAIANYCRGCVRRLRSGDWKREELLEALEKSAVQAERAGGIIQRVREYLRKRDAVPAACEINSLIGSVAATVEAEAGRRDARIRLELDPQAPPVLADRIMIEQVLLNLIRNGLDAMRETPARARELTISTACDERNLVSVEVADRGCGLPSQLKEHLFIPFFTTKPDGMGMGLHICRSIVERHRGRLVAAPNPGGGTRFRFTLPATRP